MNVLTRSSCERFGEVAEKSVAKSTIAGADNLSTSADDEGVVLTLVEAWLFGFVSWCTGGQGISWRRHGPGIQLGVW